MSGSGGPPQHAGTPKHSLRNAVILGAFIAVVISSALEAASVLPKMSAVVLLAATLVAYAAVVGVAVTVRYFVTGKNVHQ